nr:MAG TPA: hypothetical protein [Caudoviricetes sp.]
MLEKIGDERLIEYVYRIVKDMEKRNGIQRKNHEDAGKDR